MESFPEDWTVRYAIFVLSVCYQNSKTKDN